MVMMVYWWPNNQLRNGKLLLYFTVEMKPRNIRCIDRRQREMYRVFVNQNRIMHHTFFIFNQSNIVSKWIQFNVIMLRVMWQYFVWRIEKKFKMKKSLQHSLLWQANINVISSDDNPMLLKSVDIWELKKITEKWCDDFEKKFISNQKKHSFSFIIIIMMMMMMK